MKKIIIISILLLTHNLYPKTKIVYNGTFITQTSAYTFSKAKIKKGPNIKKENITDELPIGSKVLILSVMPGKEKRPHKAVKERTENGHKQAWRKIQYKKAGKTLQGHI